MPPKRKQPEDSSEATTRSTRSSTRSKAVVPQIDANGSMPITTVAKKGVKTAGSKDLGSEPQPRKKARTVKTTGKGKKQKGDSWNDDESSTTANDDGVKRSKSSSTTHVEPPPPSFKAVEPPKTVMPPPQEQPYTPKRALALFDTYADPDEPNIIGPEGFERLCTDAGLSMEGPVPLILAWQMEAQEMAKISKEEWVKGTGALRIASLHQFSVVLTDLEDLLIYEKPPPKRSKRDSYDRTNYRALTSDVRDAFRKLYVYCFTLVKPPSSKNIEMETAVAFWSVLLAPKFPLMKEILEYIDEKGTYRAANKDLWNMMLEFCETVNPNLDNYEADGAWPTLLDEFASWKMANSAA